MTERLKNMMDREAAVDFAAVDLDAITAAGDRTVRRRRIGAGVAGVAALAVVAGGVALFGGDDGSGKADFVDDAFRTDVPMWTEGSTLHTPDGTTDLGIDVASFVRTSEGIVFLGWDGNQESRFGVYAYSGEGEPVRIGETRDSRLRSDPQGPFVGWLEESEAGEGESVVHDVSTGERVWSDPDGPGPSYPLFAIDDGNAYLSQDGGPTLRVDLPSGTTTPVPALGDHRRVVAVDGDLVAYPDESTDDGTDGLIVGPVGVGGVEIPGGDGAVFSPGGEWISVFGDQASVYSTATGDRVAVDPGGYPNSLGFDWLDGDTLLVIAGSETADEIALLSCEIPAGTCEQVTGLGGFESGRLFAISLGESIWGVAGEDSASSSEASDVAPPPTTASAEATE